MAHVTFTETRNIRMQNVDVKYISKLLHMIHFIHGKYRSCVWIIKSLLSQILRYHIEPTELCGKVKLSQSLTSGKYSLNSEEKEKCCSESSDPPEYDEFNVDLLYKLLKNLCPSLKPTKGWGEKPDSTDTKLGDDVERLIQFRDIHFEYADTSKFDPSKYEEIWSEIMSASKRIHIVTKANYERFFMDFEATKIAVSEIRGCQSKVERLLRKESLEKTPQILGNIIGTKGNKTVMKVFLCWDDKEGLKQIQDVSNIGCQHINIDVLNIVSESEVILNDAEKIQLEEKKSTDLDESTKTKLEEVITQNENQLYQSYSNIIGIGMSNVRCDGNNFVKEPCIVLYCLDKHIVPFGEEPLPTSIEGWPCDHREKIALRKHFFLFDKLLSDHNFAVKSWKKKDMPDTAILINNPHILHYITGVHGNKTVLKIFVRGDDKEEKKIEDDLKKEWFPHLKYIQIEFFNIEKESEGISKDAQEIEQEEKISINVDESTRTQLEDVITKNQNHLYQRYSNIIGIGISNVRCKRKKKGRKFLKQPCIVLYCLDKHIVPFGEEPLPTSIDGWPCDHREDFAMLETCPFPCPSPDYDYPELGCSIGPDLETTGSVGFMVQSQNESKSTGFLTAAHVAVTNLENRLHFPEVHLNKTDEIWHPSSADDNKNCTEVGCVVNAFYGNYNGRGLDVAHIKSYLDREVSEDLTVTTDEELNPFAPFQFKVRKIGKETDITTGYIKDRKFSMRNWKGLGPFADCYSISKGESGVFSRPGDSGAGVFWVQTDEKQKPLGILLGGLPKSQLKVVCKIDRVLNALDLKIVRFVNKE